MAPPEARLTEGLKPQGIFFVHDPMMLGSASFIDKLSKLALEAELTAEALKLAHIRRVKAVRFKAALVATLIAYTLMAVAFFFIRRCF